MGRSDRWLLAFVVGLAAFLAVQLRGPIDARWDGAVYYILGTSLAEGHGYRLLNEPGDIEAVQYPPLLPLVVAGMQRALGTSDFVVVGTWLRGLYLVVGLALTAATYRLATRYLPPLRACVATTIAAVAVHVWYLGGVLYTEIPFSLVAVLFVLCARRADRTPYWLATAALGAAGYLLRTAGLALLLAWIAEALLGWIAAASRGWIAAASRGWTADAGRGEPAQPRPRSDGRPLASSFRQVAARTAIALVPVLAWQAWVGSVTASVAYRHPAYPYQRAPYQYSNVPYSENMGLANPFAPEEGRLTTGALVARIARNVAVVPSALGGAVTAQREFWEITVHAVNRRVFGRDVIPTSAALFPMTVIGVFVIAGAVVSIRRGDWLMPLVCAAATASMCLTPWTEQFVRYYTPVAPFVAILLVVSLGMLADHGGAIGLARWARRGAALAVVLLVLGQNAFAGAWTFLVQGARPIVYEAADGRAVSARLLFYDERYAALDQALAEVRRRARRGDVMATSAPHWAYLRTGVDAILPPMEADHDEARRLLDAVPVRFVVLDEIGYPGISLRYAAPAVEAQGGQWKETYRTDDGLARVYERGW
jgi:hypothetical protein